jgi:hypothetical protein
LLQVPQLALSVLRLTQAPLHGVVPLGQTVWHAPLTQVFPPWQAVPQVPQLLPSVLRLAQVPLQLVVPAGQTTWQAPLTQVMPLAQA